MPRILVAGLGRIGSLDDAGNMSMARSHIGVALDTGWEIAGLADPDQLARDKAQQQWQDRTNCPVFDGLDKCPAGIADLIVLATPTGNHLKDIKSALALQPAAILLEKPIANDLADATEICQLAMSGETVVHINYMRRFAPAIQAALIAHKDRPRLVEITYAGGVLNMASHYIDLLLGHFGPPHTVQATSDAVGGGPNDPGYSFTLSFDGFQAHFSALPSTEYGLLEARLFYPGQRLDVTDNGLAQVFYDAKDGHLFPGYLHLAETRRHNSRDLGLHGIYGFLQTIINGHDQKPAAGNMAAATPLDALITLKACLAVHESAQHQNSIITL